MSSIRWKPFVILDTGKTKSFDTYKELKKELPTLLKESRESQLRVSRSRRGEWGEWFEVWELVGGKPEIVKQGWM